MSESKFFFALAMVFLAPHFSPVTALLLGAAYLAVSALLILAGKK